MYIADLKASAYSCHFFCSACFQLRSTATCMLLLIRRLGRYLVELTIEICTQGRPIVVHGVRILRQ